MFIELLTTMCICLAFTRAKALPRYVTKKEEILAVGRELLIKELPLKLRLIGLRITSLKDLRPAANANGIEKVCTHIMFCSVGTCCSLADPDPDLRNSFSRMRRRRSASLTSWSRGYNSWTLWMLMAMI